MENRTKGFVCVLLLSASLIAGRQSAAQGKGQSATPTTPSPANSSPSTSGSAAGAGSGLQGKSFTRDIWDQQLTQLPKARDFGASEKDMVFVCYKLAVTKNSSIPFSLNNVPMDATPDNPPQWEAKHAYHTNDLVYSSNHNGHYYQAQSDGTSDTQEPNFVAKDGGTIQEKTGLNWTDVGYFGYSPFVPRWSPQTRYVVGDFVAMSRSTGHYYKAKSSGTSGAVEPRPKTKKEGEVVQDSDNLSWIDMGEMATHGKRECADVTSNHPLLMNQMLVVAIEMSAIPKDIQERFSLLNFNVTTTSVAPINPTPIQPSITAGTATGLEGGAGGFSVENVEERNPAKRQIYYLTWPSLISGDTITSISVNVVYTPVAPALPWKPRTVYPAGSIVMSTDPAGTSTAGQYYLALNGGISTDISPRFEAAVVRVATFSEGSGLIWHDLGLTPPSTPPVAWAGSVAYGTGDLVIPPGPTPNGTSVPNKANGHYYRALTHAQSGTAPPNFSITGGTVREGPNLALAWTDMGSQIPAPSPLVWVSSHRYDTGELVLSPSSNGHYYRAQAGGGVSGSNAPAFPADRTRVDDGNNLSWIDMGPTVLNPIPATWSANTAYAVGAQITPTPPNGHYYQALSAGSTGPSAPAFPVDGGSVRETDALVWTDSGTTLATGSRLKQWVRLTPFMVGDTIEDRTTGHFYTVIQAGLSGQTYPNFLLPTPATVIDQNQITWQFLGTTLPSSVSTGQPQPSDQTISAVNYSFPQSHQLSYFSLTSGVVVSSIQTRSFLNTSSTSTPTWTTVKNGPIVDPVLALTVYVKPVDAERTWRPRLKDLIPGPTIAFSLSSPTSNFYFGASSAIFNRNIQLLYGFSLAKVNTLEPSSLQLSSSTAATRSQFAKGGFVGISFNILGFIQSLPSL